MNPIALKSVLYNNVRPTQDYKSLGRLTPMEKLSSNMEKAEILRTFQTSVNTRAEYFRTLNSIKNSDVVQTIIDVVMDDAFSHDFKDPLFTIEYNSGEENVSSDEKISKELNDDMTKLKLSKVVESMLDDIVFYGESFIRHKVNKGEGIVKFYDNVVLEDTMAVCEIDEPQFFLEKRGSRIYSVGVENMSHFCIGGRKIRMKVDDYFLTGTRRLDEYLRIGRSVIYPALDKIKTLQTLELADLADDIKKIIAPILVTVGVPANASPTDLVEITEKYENVLSDSFANLAKEEQLDLQTVISMLTNVKVVPSFTDGKGAISTLDISSDDKNTLEKINSNRTAIANSTGVPSYYLTLTGEAGQDKLETLKVFSRYSRKLTLLQSSIAETIAGICCLHYKAKTGVALTKENVKVKFKTVISVESLDTMEYAVASTQTLNDIFNTLSNIADSPELNVKINKEVFLKFVNKFMDKIDGVQNILVDNEQLDINKINNLSVELKNQGDVQNEF